ncbi:HupE/UreJ family protein [Nocardioides bruguierae]|nr:HupE/UreJ family protein [Nocardioides bruguierae]MCL8026912.1 HupE/UreJ family protein [Nocardioides bruguierae]
MAAGLAAAALALVGLAVPASAHGASPTLVVTRLGADATAESPVVTLVARVPLDRLDLAYGTSFAQDAADDGVDAAVTADADSITDLLLSKVSLTAADGTAWTLSVQRVTAGSVEGVDAARVVLRAVPANTATGTELTDLALTWGLVTDVIVTHQVYVGAVGTDGETSLVATLTQAEPSTSLTVTLPSGAAEPTASSLSTVREMLAIGFEHFRSGADHLLLLCLLALGVARRSLSVQASDAGTGAVKAGWRTTVRRLVLLTATFTVGHSISLALAATGLVDLPSRWVETAIALTILVTAVHAARPRLSWRWELGLTAVFGLVHGLGFAGALGELSLRGSDLVLPLLGFNLGLEAAQVLALVLVLAPLLVLARSRVATTVLAGCIGVVAASWAIERGLTTGNPLEPVVAVLLASPERVALLLALGAAALLAVRWTHPRRPVAV